MGQVYQATDTKLNRQVALNVLPALRALRLIGVIMKCARIPTVTILLPGEDHADEQR